MTYKPDVEKLGIDISIRVSAFLLALIGLVLLLLSIVPIASVGFVLVAVVLVLVALIPRIQRFAVPRLHERFFEQSLEIDENLLIFRASSLAVTVSIPVSAIDMEESRITPKKALIQYSTIEGEVQTVAIPLYLYDHQVFDTFCQILPRGKR